MRNIGCAHVQFADRTGDTFRWKGENVSTTEVEEVANMLPQISLSAVYGALMPGGDGRAGMISIIQQSDADSFDFKSLADCFQSALPSYAVPKFVRIQKDFEYTATHKVKKVNIKAEGFDIDKVKDPLFVLLPGASEFQPLTRDIYLKIMEGGYRF